MDEDVGAISYNAVEAVCLGGLMYRSRKAADLASVNRRVGCREVVETELGEVKTDSRGVGEVGTEC